MRELGRYKLLERINRGGMADVFLGLVPGGDGRGRTVAVKLLRSDISNLSELVPMFMDEAKLSVSLKHPNITKTYEFGRVDGYHFIVMEFVAGQDLRSVLDRLKVHGGVVSQRTAATVMSDVCQGLHYAHTAQDPMGQPIRIVHRDVSPQNILIGYDGKVRLIDFGIAKATSHVSQTQVGILKGKYAYMSPEQVLGEPVGPASDVFSAGVVLFELLTGRRLFTGNSDFSILERIRYAEVLPPTVVMPSVDPALEAVVLKALARDPEDRFGSALEMSQALQDAVEEMDKSESIAQRSAWVQQLFAAEYAQISNVLDKAIELGDRMALAQQGQRQLDSHRVETKPMMAAKRDTRYSRNSFMSDAWLIALAGVFSLAMIGVSLWLGVIESEIEEGSLIVTSSPSGAEVSVDGEFRGITPYSAHFKEGMHQLVIQHPKFEKIERHVQVEGNRLLNLDLKLIPLEPVKRLE